ncbi:hypothetical protein [Hydrogenimonas sp. SS33]|uniref:hypothetical protein n=1 Tax=Hydrogenimonas leucolamina TaxID=2954236 RepID=UPI00336BB0C6
MKPLFPNMLKILGIMIWSALFLQAQEINLDRPTKCGSMLCYPLYDDPNTFYYLPDKPRLAYKNGKPQFSFLKYARLKAHEKAGIGDTAGGGIVHFLVTYGASPQDVMDAETALQEKFSKAKLAGPVIYRKGHFALVTSFTKGNKEFTKTVAIGKAPLMEGQKAAVSIGLTKEGAEILWESFKSDTPDISIVFEMEFAGVRKPYKATIEGDWKRIASSHRVSAGFKYAWFGADVDMLFQELRQTGAVKITAKGDDKQMDKIIDSVNAYLLKMMFEPAQPDELTRAEVEKGGYPNLDKAIEMLKLDKALKKESSSRLLFPAGYGPNFTAGPLPEHTVLDFSIITPAWGGNESIFETNYRMAIDTCGISSIFSPSSYNIDHILECQSMASDMYHQLYLYPDEVHDSIKTLYNIYVIELPKLISMISGTKKLSRRLMEELAQEQNQAFTDTMKKMSSMLSSVKKKLVSYEEAKPCFERKAKETKKGSAHSGTSHSRHSRHAAKKRAEKKFDEAKKCVHELQRSLVHTAEGIKKCDKKVISAMRMKKYLPEWKRKELARYSRLLGKYSKESALPPGGESPMQYAEAHCFVQGRHMDVVCDFLLTLEEKIRSKCLEIATSTDPSTLHGEEKERFKALQKLYLEDLPDCKGATKKDYEEANRRYAEARKCYNEVKKLGFPEKKSEACLLTIANALKMSSLLKGSQTSDLGIWQRELEEKVHPEVAANDELGQKPESAKAAPPATTTSSNDKNGSKGTESKEQKKSSPPKKAKAPHPISLIASYRLKHIKRSGHFKMTLNRFRTETQAFTMSENIGPLYRRWGSDPSVFRAVLIDDPVFKQRDIFVTLDGQDADTFAKHINFVTVRMRKRHQSGAVTTDEVVITPDLFNEKGNNFVLRYGWKGDNDREAWLDYEIQATWSFHGGVEITQPWEHRNSAMLSVAPPFKYRTLSIEGDAQTLREAKVRHAVVTFESSIDGKTLKTEVTIRNQGAAPTALVDIPVGMDGKTTATITWYLKGGKKIVSKPIPVVGDILYWDELEV